MAVMGMRPSLVKPDRPRSVEQLVPTTPAPWAVERYPLLIMVTAMEGAGKDPGHFRVNFLIKIEGRQPFSTYD